MNRRQALQKGRDGGAIRIVELRQVTLYGGHLRSIGVDRETIRARLEAVLEGLRNVLLRPFADPGLVVRRDVGDVTVADRGRAAAERLAGDTDAEEVSRAV